MAKSGVSLIGVMGMVLSVVLLVNQMADSAPAVYDYDNLRDLYEILMRNEGLQSPTRYVHQMERKGGRSPTLRLRFGRRADPLWGASGPISADNPSDKSLFS